MVVSSKFSGLSSTGGQSGLLSASLNFMVAPTAANQQALTEAYAESKPGHMASLSEYFGKHGLSEAPKAAAPAASAAKKPGSGF